MCIPVASAICPQLMHRQKSQLSYELINAGTVQNNVSSGDDGCDGLNLSGYCQGEQWSSPWQRCIVSKQHWSDLILGDLNSGMCVQSCTC